MTRAKWLIRFGEGFFFGVGLSLLGFVTFQYTAGWIGGMRAEHELRELLAEQSPQREEIITHSALALEPAVMPGAVLGRLVIPRLEMAVVVLEGTAEETMLRGAGHVEGTALPGMVGNVVVAAHRDMHFEPLRYGQRGDEIELQTPRGTRRYVVETIEVVDPTDVAVLESEDDQLVLITCYPFRFVGRAPQRYVVRARPVEEEADPPAELVIASAPTALGTRLVQSARA